MNELDALYRELILDHSKHPQHFGLPAGDAPAHTGESYQKNPVCGDEITLRARVDGETVADVVWEGRGCSISQASTSVMCDLVIGRDVADSMALFDEFRDMMESQGRIEPDEDRLEDGIAFAGVAQFPARVKCAMLGWSALRDALIRAGVELPASRDDKE